MCLNTWNPSFGAACHCQGFAWGREPDLLLSDLVSGCVLQPDGTLIAPEGEHYTVTYQRTLGVIETRFGLSLSSAYLKEARLPAYAVRGAPGMHI